MLWWSVEWFWVASQLLLMHRHNSLYFIVLVQEGNKYDSTTRFPSVLFCFSFLIIITLYHCRLRRVLLFGKSEGMRLCSGLHKHLWWRRSTLRRRRWEIKMNSDTPEPHTIRVFTQHLAAGTVVRTRLSSCLPSSPARHVFIIVRACIAVTVESQLVQLQSAAQSTCNKHSLQLCRFRPAALEFVYWLANSSLLRTSMKLYH